MRLFVLRAGKRAHGISILTALGHHRSSAHQRQHPRHLGTVARSRSLTRPRQPRLHRPPLPYSPLPKPHNRPLLLLDRQPLLHRQQHPRLARRRMRQPPLQGPRHLEMHSRRSTQPRESHLRRQPAPLRSAPYSIDGSVAALQPRFPRAATLNQLAQPQLFLFRSIRRRPNSACLSMRWVTHSAKK